MDLYKKNLYTVSNLKMINQELDNIDRVLENKIITNKIQIKNIMSIMNNSLNDFYTILQNLDDNLNNDLDNEINDNEMN